VTNKPDYLADLPVEMSEEGVEKLMGMFLGGTCSNPEIVEKYFIQARKDGVQLDHCVYRTIVMTVVGSMVEQGSDPATGELPEPDGCGNCDECSCDSDAGC